MRVKRGDVIDIGFHSGAKLWEATVGEIAQDGYHVFDKNGRWYFVRNWDWIAASKQPELPKEVEMKPRDEAKWTVKIRESVYVELEPGDATFYKLWYSRRPVDLWSGAVVVSLQDLGRYGASFSFATDALDRVWQVANESESIEEFAESGEVFELRELLGYGDAKKGNPWTARAIAQGWQIAKEGF